MHSWDCHGYDYYQYVRYFEFNFLLEEWVWTNEECNNPAPANTPNPDPGKPDCPQLSLS